MRPNLRIVTYARHDVDHHPGRESGARRDYCTRSNDGPRGVDESCELGSGQPGDDFRPNARFTYRDEILRLLTDIMIVYMTFWACHTRNRFEGSRGIVEKPDLTRRSRKPGV
jgi:hypothetical protein